MVQGNPRFRWLLIWIVATIWMIMIVARLADLQLLHYSDYLAKAQRQQQRVFEISPMRGTIYDRKGRELAVSLPMDSVFADPPEISDPVMVAQLLSRVLQMPADDIETKIRSSHTPVRIAKKLPPEIVQRIADMNLRGVFFQKENRRVYPQRELAAHVLGFVDVDEKGLGGIEHSLDSTIRGRPGKMMVMADGKRRLYDRRESAPDPGGAVTLTIDETIQYIAEKELAQGVEQTHAKHGTVVVQNPNTGELLAVANWPPFDPNDAGKYPDDVRMDRAVSAAYEPGSMFKVLTMTGAIEDGLTNPAELIDCQMGSITVAGRVIHDDARFGVMSVRDILVHSSNVGAIKIALRLGTSRLYDTMRAFDIGEPTGITLPGENRGLLRPVSQWSATSIASIAIGQEVSVTPIQMASAISAVANGGTYNRPTIVRDIQSAKATPELVNYQSHAATDERTADTVREMMEAVVLRGTGTSAQLDGYTAAGKSGTAQKVDPATGRYSKTDYSSSFVGFAPVANPAITILVTLDSPVGGHLGGPTDGPIFKRIAQQVLTYMGVPHDTQSRNDTQTAKLEKGSHQMIPAANRSGDSEQTARASFEALIQEKPAWAASRTVSFGDARMLVVPNVIGASVRSVTETCSRMGLDPELIGDGVALQQYPEAGTQVGVGTRLSVRFGSASALPAVPPQGGGN